LELPLENLQNEYHVQTVFMQPAQIEDCSSIPEVMRAIRTLWDDSGFQDAYKRRREYQLLDSFRDYARDVERLWSQDYVPTNKDILRSRVKTTSLSERTFQRRDASYRIIDVGGVRSERKEWIHAFENAPIIASTIDAHCYAKLLFEDETVNRMQEQLTLFDSIVNSRWFQRSHFLVIFTKMDRLEEWLNTTPVETYFPDYVQKPGLGVVTSYMCYLEDRFTSLIQSDAIRERIRILRVNLVDDHLKNGCGQQVWETLDELSQKRLF
jgi:guanine nucleotide-binding protein subunit alpha